MTRVTPLDRAVAGLVGKALVWLGKRAHDRGDVHEYRHALAALNAGNCTCVTPSGGGDAS